MTFIPALSRHLKAFIPALTAILALQSCNIQIPDHITSNSNVDGTVQVQHEVRIDANLQAMFAEDCNKKAEALGLPPESEAYNTAVNACIAERTKAFMDTIMKYIEENNEKDQQ